MLKRIVVIFLFLQVSFGQTKAGVELCLEYQKTVSGFTSEKEANEALDKILNVIGASKNFTLIPCDNILNALAVTYKGERYILYDGYFMKKITEVTNDWSSTFILAHEVGHHINGHTRDFLLANFLDNQSLEDRRKEELEADEFAGFIVSKLGATFLEVQELINLVSEVDNDNFSTHPNKSKRLLAVKKGFDKAVSQTKNYTTNDSSISSFKVNGEWTINEVDLEKKIRNYYSDPRYFNPDHWSGNPPNEFDVIRRLNNDLGLIEQFGSKQKTVTLTGQVLNGNTNKLISTDSILPKLSFDFFEMKSEQLFFNRNQFISIHNIEPIINNALRNMFEDKIFKDSLYISWDNQPRWEFQYEKKLKDEFKFFDEYIEYNTSLLTDTELKDEYKHKYFNPEAKKLKYKAKNTYRGGLIIKGEYLIDNDTLGCFILSYEDWTTPLSNDNRFNYDNEWKYKNPIFSYFLPYCNLTNPIKAEQEFISKLKNSSKLIIKLDSLIFQSTMFRLKGDGDIDFNPQLHPIGTDFIWRNDINGMYFNQIAPKNFRFWTYDQYWFNTLFNLSDSPLFSYSGRIYDSFYDGGSWQDSVRLNNSPELINSVIENWFDGIHYYKEEAIIMLNGLNSLESINFNEKIIFDLSGASEALKRP